MRPNDSPLFPRPGSNQPPTTLNKHPDHRHCLLVAIREKKHNNQYNLMHLKNSSYRSYKIWYIWEVDSKSYYYQSRNFISFHIIVNSWSSKDFLLAKQFVKLLLGYFSMNIKSWPNKSVKLKSYLCFKLNLPFLITQVPYDIKDYTLLWTSITVLQAYSLKGRLIR